MQARVYAGFAEEKHAELYEYAPSGFLILSKAGKITDLNINAVFLLEKDEENDRLKPALLVNMSHVIRTPLICFILFFLSYISVSSQGNQVTRDNYTGYWESPGSWNPQWNTPLTRDINQDIVIKGFITSRVGLIISPKHLTIEKNDTLVIEGDLELGKDAELRIQDNAVLIVLGSVFITDSKTKHIDVHKDAYFVVSGDFKVQSGAEMTHFKGDDAQPNIFIGGEIWPIAITDDDNKYASLNCKNPKERYQESGCAYGNFDDFQIDPLYPFYQSLICGDSPAITMMPVDATICENSSYAISGVTVTNGNDDYSWSHNGKGSLSGATTLTPTYVPGVLDVGQTVILTLIAKAEPDCADATDQMNIIVEAAVVAHVGVDITICQNSSHTVSGANVTNGTGSYLWTHNGGGSVNDSNTLTPTYTPTASDAGKTVVLTLTAQGNADCAQATNQMQIHVAAAVMADAGLDANICQNSTHTISGATVTNGNGTYLWSHNGQGNLLDATTLTPNYTPNVSDAGGVVVLTLTAQGNADCTPVTDQMEINVAAAVMANAGSDTIICQNSTHTISGATVTNGNGTYLWSHNGQGNLLDATTLTPNYTPVASDAGETVTLTLTAQGNADCVQTTDQMEINAAAAVTANAGSDSNICQSSTHTISGATVTNGNGTYLWSHNGQGTLSGVATQTPTYTANASDAGETVTLMLTAHGNADCAQATDQMEINVAAAVTANAGSDSNICQSSTHTINGALVTNGNGNYLWTHNGSRRPFGCHYAHT